MKDRNSILKMWNDAWDKGPWWTAWSKIFIGVTAEQAAWKPNENIHSIWQVANHIIFWHDYVVGKLEGNPIPDSDIEVRNWEEPAEITDDAWQETVARFKSSHEYMSKAIADESKSLDELMYFLAHDNYHIGQIITLRQLQGLEKVS